MMGFGTTVSLPGMITPAKITEVSVDGDETKSIDQTHMLSADGYMEFDPSSLTDPGTLELSILFNPNEVPVKGVKDTITITWPVPAGGSSGATWACQGFVTKYNCTGPHDDKMTGKVSLKFSGKPTRIASS